MQIGNEIFPTNPSTLTCSGIYTVIVLDRSDLTENSQSCVDDGAALKTYLSNLAGNQEDLVIVGTNWSKNSDAGAAAGHLNTMAIGGSDYIAPPDPRRQPCALPTGQTQGTSPDKPNGYLAIGFAGAAGMSAYKNYNVANPLAKGMLVEDHDGHYNLQQGARSSTSSTQTIRLTPEQVRLPLPFRQPPLLLLDSKQRFTRCQRPTGSGVVGCWSWRETR